MSSLVARQANGASTQTDRLYVCAGCGVRSERSPVRSSASVKFAFCARSSLAPATGDRATQTHTHFQETLSDWARTLSSLFAAAADGNLTQPVASGSHQTATRERREQTEGVSFVFPASTLVMYFE